MALVAPLRRGDDYAGIRPHRRQYEARLCMYRALRLRWVHLGLFPTERDAAIVTAFAQTLRESGALDDCTSAKEVRDTVRQAAAFNPRVRDCYNL